MNCLDLDVASFEFFMYKTQPLQCRVQALSPTCGEQGRKQACQHY